MFNFDGKVAIITGATRGIGLAMVRAFAEAKAHVAFINRNEEDAHKLCEELEARDCKNIAIQGSIDDREKCQLLVSRVLEEFGQIDFLINNAGITQDNLFIKMKPEQWSNVINVNLNGLFQITQAVLKPMMKERFGRIVNISSVVGYTGNPGQVNYSTAKAGVIGFTKSLAKEFASRNILCNAIAPGFIETDMTAKLNENQKEQIMKEVPLKKMGTGEDIAKGAMFLCSPAAKYITGETLHINGGLY